MVLAGLIVGVLVLVLSGVIEESRLVHVIVEVFVLLLGFGTGIVG